MVITKTQLEAMLEKGEVFIGSYCYMTDEYEPAGCGDCMNYSCCVVNGTGTPGKSLRGVIRKSDKEVLCDVDHVVNDRYY